MMAETGVTAYLRSRPTHVRGNIALLAPMLHRAIAAAIALPLLALTVNLPSAYADIAGAKAGSSTSPGRFTGYAFDTCAAPSQREMNVLRRESPFWAAGIY